MNTYSVQLSLKDGVKEFFTTDNKEEAYNKAMQWLKENELSKDKYGVYDSLYLRKSRKAFNPIRFEEITPETKFKEQIAKEFFYGIN